VGARRWQAVNIPHESPPERRVRPSSEATATFGAGNGGRWIGRCPQFVAQ